MPNINVTAEMGEGQPPESVRLSVEQGPHTLQSAEVEPRQPSASFDVDEGDYVARAQSLVPHGTPAETSFSVPIRVHVE